MEETRKFDTIIVGAGPSGIFCAYKMMKLNPNLKIVMFEKGSEIEHRICPKRTTGKCVHCRSRNFFRWKVNTCFF